MAIKQVIAASLATLLTINSVQAGLDTHLNSMFNQMSSTSAPAGYYQTARRGALSAGSTDARTPIVVNPNIVSFTPPSFSAGCNGISLHGGALSFINMEQFQNTIRSIGSNAVGVASGYAFKMALSAMCEGCAQELTSLMNNVQNVAKGLKNSCEAAKALTASVGATAETYVDNRKQTVAADGADKGLFSDFLTGTNKFLTSGPLSSLSSTAKAKFVGNVVYEALDGKVGAWYVSGAGDADVLTRTLMSITGTFIIGTNAAGDDFETSNVPGRPGIVQKLLEGGQVTIYKCAEDPSGKACTKVSDGNTEDITIKGFVPQVRELLQGSGSNVGIIAKLSQKGLPSLSDQEKALMASMRPNFRGLLEELALSKGANSVMTDHMVSIIASEMLYNYLSQSMMAMRSALVGAGKAETKEPLAALDKTFNDEVKPLRDLAHKELSAFSNLTVVSNGLRDIVRRKQPVSTK
jgi:conjugative transfer pilus assembly protein TraH